MKCPRCPDGQMTAGTTTQTLERGETTLVVRHVPAQVCDLCGESLLEPDITTQLLELLDHEVQQRTRVLVQDFTPAETHGQTEKSGSGRVGAPRR